MFKKTEAGIKILNMAMGSEDFSLFVFFILFKPGAIFYNLLEKAWRTLSNH